MRFLRAYVRFVDRLNENIGIGVSWLTSLLVVVICYDVLVRYLFKNSTVAIQEMEWHIFSVIFLIGAAYTLKHDKHVRVDVLYMYFTPKTKALVNFLGSLLFLAPFSLIIIWSSRNFVLNSFNIGEVSPDPGGLPARYILKAMIPLGSILVLLQGLALSFRSWIELVTKEDHGV